MKTRAVEYSWMYLVFGPYCLTLHMNYVWARENRGTWSVHVEVVISNITDRSDCTLPTCKYKSQNLCKLSLCVAEMGQVGSGVPVWTAAATCCVNPVNHIFYKQIASLRRLFSPVTIHGLDWDQNTSTALVFLSVYFLRRYHRALYQSF